MQHPHTHKHKCMCYVLARTHFEYTPYPNTVRYVRGGQKRPTMCSFLATQYGQPCLWCYNCNISSWKTPKVGNYWRLKQTSFLIRFTVLTQFGHVHTCPIDTVHHAVYMYFKLCTLHIFYTLRATHWCFVNSFDDVVCEVCSIQGDRGPWNLVVLPLQVSEQGAGGVPEPVDEPSSWAAVVNGMGSCTS